jgi:hypothetical protein
MDPSFTVTLLPICRITPTSTNLIPAHWRDA